MPPDHLVLKKETRMLGAVQVMIGLINGALGRIWLLFYTRQFEELSVEYKPIALLSGYPFWTFLFFIISGVLTIQTEKKRSPNSQRSQSKKKQTYLKVIHLEDTTGFQRKEEKVSGHL
uniref:Uncharacterized LOC113905212 n=1 Tax=Bos indicus x Bos taurus TaxID=30522 RepID=A0A4W2GYY4_BOBOX